MTKPYIEGYFPKKNIRRFLEHYNDIRRGDYSWREPTNSGPKVYDGITSGQLNKIEIDQAIEKLPKMIKAVCRARWIMDLPAGKTIRTLGISSSQYDYYSKKAVDLIYQEINGEMIGVMKLLQAIKEG